MNRWLSLLLTLSMMLSMVTPVLSQEPDRPGYTLFIPAALHPAPPTTVPGKYQPITASDCAALVVDSFGNSLFALTKVQWSNGTKFEKISDFYNMHPGDWAEWNYPFFQGDTIDAIGGKSGICIPKKYTVQFPLPGTPNFDDLIMRFPDGVPGWEQHLWDSAEIQVSQTTTETFTLLGFAIVADSWWGAPVVGTLEKGGKVWGTIVKSAGTAGRLFSNSIAIAVPLVALVERVANESLNGVTYAATPLDDTGAGIFYFSRDPAPEELVHTAYFVDAVSQAENMDPPNIIRLYTFGDGHNQEGFIMYKEALGISGEKPSEFRIAKEAVRRGLAQRDKPWFDHIQGSSVEYVQAVEEMLEYKEDPRKPRPVPVNPGGSCNALQYDADLIAESLIATVEEVEYRIRTIPTHPTTQPMYEFWHRAGTFLPDAYLEGWHQSLPPYSILDKAHLTTDVPGPNYTRDIDGNNWTIEAICGIVMGQYVWLLNPDEGRLKTSLTSQYPVPEGVEPDYRPRYTYQ